jgi:hypothetical protein
VDLHVTALSGRFTTLMRMRENDKGTRWGRIGRVTSFLQLLTVDCVFLTMKGV